MVRSIEVDDDTYEKLQFGARVSGVSIPELVRRLVAAPDERTATVMSPAALHEARVFVSYQGRRIDGFFDVDSERLRITEGPPGLPGRTFKSPTKAAVEVVKVVNPDRQSPQTNGWRFWRELESGQIIDRVYRRS